jgi:hypothetical protein
MNDELDFAGAYAVLLALGVSAVWLAMVAVAGLIKLDQKVQALRARLRRKVPVYRNPRFPGVQG